MVFVGVFEDFCVKVVVVFEATLTNPPKCQENLWSRFKNFIYVAGDEIGMMAPRTHLSVCMYVYECGSDRC